MSLNNGHAQAKMPSQSAGARRSRLFRARKARGAVILQAEIQPDMISDLVQLGWLNSIEVRNRRAVTDAIGACLHQALAAEMKPAQARQAVRPRRFDGPRKRSALAQTSGADQRGIGGESCRDRFDVR